MSDSAPAGSTALFSLHGMWCTSCALAVEGVLKRAPGITQASVHYPTATVYVQGEAQAIALTTLAPRVSRIGYRLGELEAVQDAAERLEQEGRYLSLRLGVAAVFGMWTMLASILIYAGAVPAGRIELVMAWVSGAFSLPVVLYAGVPFYRAGFRTLLARRPGMDVLVSLGVLGAMAVSVWLLGQGSVEVYFDTAVMLIALLLVGRLAETLCRQRGLKAFEALALAPGDVTLEREGQIASHPLSAACMNDVQRLAPGETLLLDGELMSAGWFDTATLSGESVPRYLVAGQRVYAGYRFIEADGEVALRLRVNATPGERRRDHLCEQMRLLQTQKGELHKLADRFAAWLSPVALVLALITLPVAFMLGASLDEAVVRALSVLVVACPCAVGLAVPLATLAGSDQALQRGVALRDPGAFETLARVRAVAFDKTGTLTAGRHRVVHAECRDALGGDFHRKLAAATRQSEHPLAQGLLRWALESGDKQNEEEGVSRVVRLDEVAGAGRVIAFERGERWWMGSLGWLGERGVTLEGAAHQADHAFASQVVLADERGWLATFYLADPPVEDGRASVRALQAQGYLTALISGDRQGAVSWLGEQVGLAPNACYAQRSPEAKARLLAGLASPTLYVGDGVNDTLCLAAAGVGVAPMQASDAAREGAAAQLLRPGVGGVVQLLRLARRTRNVMRQNLVFSAVYNTLALGLVIVMAVPPLAAVLAMAASSLSVTLNAARLAWAPVDGDSAKGSP
ncbi:cation-translocating P-type ATPase [Halomonas sp. PAMB 3232]|uniref:heavy metal translocating P-type ATPase n=1 Tax=Halomonas sp. PAMB 3232 TaxID=3075221 RepID=UPI00289B6FE4|nr:cation-translocating P-type ATPase [Halomonas sp. PAMB 3232]WNL37758.1 cation-translocating P-type ATPase [Halomonas sp. PAMB 3232]